MTSRVWKVGGIRKAVGVEGEGNGFVIGFPTSTRRAFGGCGGFTGLRLPPTLHWRRGHHIMGPIVPRFVMFCLLLNFLYVDMFFYPIFIGFWTPSKLRFVVPSILLSCFSCCEKVMIVMTCGLPKWCQNLKKIGVWPPGTIIFYVFSLYAFFNNHVLP